MFSGKNILFNYQSLLIDSVYAFDDGDFIIFGNGEIFENRENIKCSSLFDGKSFAHKLTLKIASDSCFYDLKNDDEFGMCFNYKFTLNKFDQGRNSFKEIQPMKLNDFETGKKLMRLKNGDILFFKYYMGSQAISVFKKTNGDYMYNNVNKFQIEDLEDLIEINKNKLLGYKRSITIPETLKLTIFDDNYQVIKKNTIIAEIKDHLYNYKKKLYFTIDIQKINDNKVITAGCNNIYIIDINTLELETTIKLEKTIRKLLIRPKGNIFVLTYASNDFKKDIYRQSNQNCLDYFINNILIDFKTNEMISNEEKDITEKAGIYNSCFDMYNYLNNGMIVNIDKSKLIIYGNIDD